MRGVTVIEDLLDPRLDPYARLTERQLKSVRDPENAVFIAESKTVVTLALEAGCEPLSLLAERGQIEGGARELIGRVLAGRYGDVPVYTAEDQLLDRLTGFALSRGVLAVMRRPPLRSVEEVCAGARRIAVLEDIMDAANVGALIRSAAALGMDAVLITPRCSDPLLRRAARVSMGTVFQIPWTRIGANPTDWPGEGMKKLRDLGFRTAAMTLSPDSVSVRDERLKAAEKLAILIGTEGTGLCAETVRLSDYAVKIPMYHGVDSLNAAAAGAVAFWEIGKKD